MSNMYLTPASLGYLTQLIMALMITSYFVIRLMRRRDSRSAQMALLTGFFACVTLLALLFFLETSLQPTGRLYVVFLQNTVLGVGIVLLLQFVYRFPLPLPHKWEARLVLGLSVLYALYEALYAMYRFGLLFTQGQVIFRPPWADYSMALGLMWAPAMLIRQTVQTSEPLSLPDPTGLRRLWRPRGRAAHTARALMLVYLLPFGISLLTILKTFYFIHPDLYQLSLSLGVVIALAAFAIIYLNYQPEMTSFMVKLAGLTLMAPLAVLGAVGWVITPSYAKHYHPVWLDHQTLRSAPNAAGGYDIASIPFRFESDLGANLHLMDAIERVDQKAGAKLDFAFPFYGQTWSQVYATNDGSIAMGQDVFYRDYQYHYGGQTPLIFAVLIDLIPEAGSGGVFARQEADRLILTWDRVPSFYWREAVFTFQVVLYHTGVFEITYNGMPDRIEYRANDEPMANVWVVGSVPGDTAREPQRMDVSQLAQGYTLTSGPDGVVQDYYLDFRRHLHTLLLPLAYLMISASLLVVLGFPFLFYLNLVRPLNTLMAGVRQMNAGHRDVVVPVQFADEIGFLAQSFNAMAAELYALVANLEARVAERTGQLELQTSELVRAKESVEAANAELARRLAELGERNAELDAFAQTVAHDLKGPLSMLIGYADLVSDNRSSLGDAEQQQCLTNIGNIAYKMDGIVGELLTLSEVRKADVKLQPLDMSSLVAEAQHRLSQMIAESRAEITCPSVWPQALGHAPWVEEVWVNYLGNALKYGGRPPRIELGVDPNPLPPSGAQAGQSGGMIRFWVRDNGDGISPQDQARLFTPFTRLDRVSLKGHGLGLSIVRRIVERLSGQVGVESEGVPGRGSVFSFTLPVADAALLAGC